jgi:hypothetical protein
VSKSNTVSKSKPSKSKPPVSERWQIMSDQLSKLEGSALTIDLERRSEYTEGRGWRIDDHHGELPSETSGEPLEHGSFRIAQEIMRGYKFPPPDLIVGIFRPDDPLEKRVMLLEARFLWFRFLFGVRVTGVVDEHTPDEYTWGYSYATLDGHFERGEISFTITKNLVSGAIDFRIKSFSRRGTIQNIFYRIGFWMFGRRLQVRFAQASLLRMQKLVREQLHSTPSTVPESSKNPVIKPASQDPQAAEKLETLRTTGRT